MAHRIYTSNEVLDTERRRLFSRIWVFAGFAQFVQKRNQYISRRICGVPIVIQRTRNELLGFINRCPHRHMPIQEELFGCRSIVCPYHGWSFNDQGELQGLPNPGLYNFDEKECAGAGLHKIHVEQIGQMLFVNLSETPIPINSQYNESLLNQLREISEHLDNQIIYSKFPARYNWKLNMENVKDWNHIQFIHPKSFFSSIERTTPPSVPKISGVRRDSGDASLVNLSYETRIPLSINSQWFDGLVDRYGKDNVYYNWFLYPNVNFCSVRGVHFLLQQYDPVTPDLTDYHLWMMTAKRNSKGQDFSALLASFFKSERRVIEEDAVYLSRMQNALDADYDRQMLHGDYELPLILQHRWYKENVWNDSES